MVIVLGNYEYTLSDLPDKSKLLTIGRKAYHWQTDNGGHGKLTRIRSHAVRSPVYRGNCWLFNAVQNPRFTRGVHLSLVLRPGEWAEFTLSDTLPEKIGDSCTIDPTDERIAWSQAQTMLT